MSIANITTDYTGRTIDINIAGSKDGKNKSAMSLSFGDTSSHVTGVQKLVQRYTIALLTKLGSQTDTPTFGTDFISALQGNLTASDIEHILVFANAKVISEFREYQESTEALPLDEQINTVSIDTLTYELGVLNLKLSISTMAGNTIDYILPIPN
jgi:hypothetical protein